jgi:hypothetical protein
VNTVIASRYSGDKWLQYTSNNKAQMTFYTLSIQVVLALEQRYLEELVGWLRIEIFRLDSTLYLYHR